MVSSVRTRNAERHDRGYGEGDSSMDGTLNSEAVNTGNSDVR